MTDLKNRNRILYPLGITPEAGGASILIQAEGESAELLLYHAGEKKPCEKIPFPKEGRIGNVWAMFLERDGLENMEFAFESDGKPVEDPCAKIVTGREKWGDASRAGKPVRERILSEEFDWEEDRHPETPYSDTIIYRLHVRGFTKHASSKVKAPGTYAGAMEKIPYLKELGITAVELLPVTEFEEVLMSQATAGAPGAKAMPTGHLNYWGYGPSYLYAVKAAYAEGKGKAAHGGGQNGQKTDGMPKDRCVLSPEAEFKTFVKELHKAGIECIVEMYFTGRELPDAVLPMLRYWVQEYHVDGFKFSGFPPVRLIADDPFLKRTKLFAENWNEVMEHRPARGYAMPGDGKVTMADKYLAEYNGSFMEDMRRFLKGDEGMLSAFEFRSRRNPADYAVINYMANTNGFTMMDTVTYDRKHNEANGEENRDGSDYNFSWNCGVEGPTRKKKASALRRQQLRNAFALLFLSQGVPLILAGDEFGNSQDGNNNAYCQDNAISWLNWKLLDTNKELYEFVKKLIQFRREHPVFHKEREPRLMDYRACGCPDVSYHGENAWRPEFENFRRQFGILYWGPYEKKEDGSSDDTFYVAYNMHWEGHEFGLPHVPKGMKWRVVCDTSKDAENGFYEKEKEPVLENQLLVEVPPRSIVILESYSG